MAKVRIGFSTQFELENELVGIGTDNPTNTLQALGNIQSSDAKAIGVSTFTTFDGFTDTKLSLEGSAGAKSGSTSGEIIIEGSVVVSSGTTFTSGPENLTVTDNFTLPGISDDKPSVGTTRFNENLGSLEFYTGVEWRAVNSIVDMGNIGRVVWAGGYDQSGSPAATTSRIDYIHVPTLGNSIRFGDLSAAGQDAHGCGSRTRGLFGGKFNGAQIDYITIASSGNGIDFGDGNAQRNYCAGASSSTRGMWLGGNTPSTVNSIDMVEIQTLGNAVDFGDLSQPRMTYGGAISDGRHIVCGGAQSPGSSSTYDRKTIATTANATDFGTLITKVGYSPGGAGNQTRGIWAGGDTKPGYSKNIQYVIMASGGNTQYFGELSEGGLAHGGGTSIRSVFSLGQTSSADVNTLEYVTIATTGNATDFGDLRGGNNRCHTRVISPVSDSHGGLGGF